MTTTKNNEHKELNVPNKQEQNQTCWDSAEREGLRPKGNVPTLRFPEFQEEWDKCELGEFATIIGGYAFKSETLNSIGGKYQVVKMGNLYQNQLDLHRSPSYTDTLTRKAENVILRKDDIAITLTGTNNKRDFGYTYIFNDEKNLLLNQRCGLIRAKGNPYFLSCLLKTHTFLNQFFESATGGTGNQANVSTKAMEMFSVNTPSLKEQEKIGQLMALLDERIATQNKIIGDLKKLKSAIVEKVYKGIQGTCYSHRQLFSIINERNKQLEYSNVLSASQERGMVSREDLNLDIHFERSNISTYKIVKNGDYVIHLRSFQGGFAFSEKTGICSPAYTVLRPNNLLVYGYLSNYFTSRDFVKSLIIVTYGIRDGRSINVDEWLDMKVVIPSKEQQTHIVNVIGSIENKIKNEETYSNCLLNQKQYLLRQMFI